MKKFLAMLGILWLSMLQLNAQTRKIYTVKPGEKILDALPLEIIYTYAAFKPGNVLFRIGKIGSAKINFNRLLDEMQFINEAGDTLSLDEAPGISSIIVESDTFYFYKGYLQQLAAIKNVRIASKSLVGISNRQKLGGMGDRAAGSVETYQKLSAAQGILDLVQKEQLTFAEYNNFFIADRFNNFKPLNKKSLVGMYVKQEYELQVYLNNNAVNFFRKEDVNKLIGFLRTL